MCRLSADRFLVFDHLVNHGRPSKHIEPNFCVFISLKYNKLIGNKIKFLSWPEVPDPGCRNFETFFSKNLGRLSVKNFVRRTIKRKTFYLMNTFSAPSSKYVVFRHLDFQISYWLFDVEGWKKLKEQPSNLTALKLSD